MVRKSESGAQMNTSFVLLVQERIDVSLTRDMTTTERSKNAESHSIVRPIRQPQLFGILRRFGDGELEREVPA